ncbi:hypothetical protein ACFSL6_14255 [Paenibacillus thailandensis]|uniref:Uncharacterized protein n=1 Tax=Paenibacillus thailandensis TaxID=393250 RepID=A0ABW5R141_9BACL
MNLIIFYDTVRYRDEIQHVINAHMQLWGQFSSVRICGLEDEVNHSEEFASIYLLNASRTPSAHLLRHVKRQHEAGANPESMLFVLNDSDRLSPDDAESVQRELSAELGKLYNQPQWMWASLRAFAVYRDALQAGTQLADTGFALWDEAQQAFLSASQLVESGQKERLLGYSQVVKLLERVTQQFLQAPEVTARRAPGKHHVYVCRTDTGWIERMNRHSSDIVFHEVREPDKLSRYVTKEDHILIYTRYDEWDSALDGFTTDCPSPVLLIDGGNERNVWEMAELVQDAAKRFPQIRVFPVSSSYLEWMDSLAAGAKTAAELARDPFIVITDSYGFPRNKAYVADWNKALFRESGIDELISYITNGRLAHAAAI